MCMLNTNLFNAPIADVAVSSVKDLEKKNNKAPAVAYVAAGSPL